MDSVIIQLRMYCSYNGRALTVTFLGDAQPEPEPQTPYLSLSSGAVLGCVECLNSIRKPQRGASMSKFSQEDVVKVELMAMQVRSVFR